MFVFIQHRRVDFKAHGRQRALAHHDLADSCHRERVGIMIVDAASYISPLVSTSEVRPTMAMGESNGLTLR